MRLYRKFKMNPHELAKKIDHTLLKPTATLKDLDLICEEAMHFQFASICIQPSNLIYAQNKLQTLAQTTHAPIVPLCTVIGFPLGANLSDVKCHEAKLAHAHGAIEFDMVLNIQALKNQQYDVVKADIDAVKKSIDGKLLKVIIETCLLTDEEKIIACQILNQTDAEFIKTSTGFSTGGATLSDVELMRKHLSPKKWVKASGGIKNKSDAGQMLKAGAARLGTSNGVLIMQDLSAQSGY